MVSEAVRKAILFSTNIDHALYAPAHCRSPWNCSSVSNERLRSQYSFSAHAGEYDTKIDHIAKPTLINTIHLNNACRLRPLPDFIKKKAGIIKPAMAKTTTNL